jgi:hypothetical protein
MKYLWMPLMLPAALAWNGVCAQQALHGVWVLNEGYGDALTGEVFEPVQVGRFDPVEQVYEVVATVDGASFASDLVVAESGIYVAAQGQILRYDRDSGDLLATAAMEGGRRLCVLGDRLYVSRGDFDQATWTPIAFGSYLVWLDALTLEWEGELTTEAGPAYACEGLVAVGSDLFVAVNNGFDWGNEVGRVGRFSPDSGDYMEYDLGASGKNPVHLLARDGVVYTVNNGDWSSTSLSRIDATSEEVMTVPVAAAAAGCNAAALVGEELAFQVSGEFDVRTVDLAQLEDQGPWLSTTMGFYAMAEDPVSGFVYASETDWFSYGAVHVFNAFGDEVAAFPCGVSPGVIAMDVREASGIGAGTPGQPGTLVRSFDLTGRELHNGVHATGWIIDVFEDGTASKRWAPALPM